MAENEEDKKKQRDLRKLYFPFVDISFNIDVDNICSTIYASLCAASTRSINTTPSINITEARFNAVFENSVSKDQKIPPVINVKLILLRDSINTRVNSTNPPLIVSDDTIPSFPIQFISPTIENASPTIENEQIMWRQLFQSFSQIRISNEYIFNRDTIKAVSFGRPNHEINSKMLNQGGCGLSALAALGIIGMDEYCFAVTNEKYLKSESGTLGTTLYKLMFSDFLREGGKLQELSLCAKRFLVHGIPPTQNQRTFETQIKNMRDYFIRTLQENSATLLRFGDEDPENPLHINETTFGHSIVVFKEEGRIHFFDGWLASLLTLKSKNMRNFTAKSWNLTVCRGLAQRAFDPLQEFTANNIKDEMILVTHVGETVFEVYEIQNNTPIPMNSSFQTRMQEMSLERIQVRALERLLPRKKSALLSGIVGRVILNNFRSPENEAAREAFYSTWEGRKRAVRNAVVGVGRSIRRSVYNASGAIGSFAQHAPGAIFNTVNRVTANGMNQLRLYTPSGQTVINLGKAAVIGLAMTFNQMPGIYRMPKENTYILGGRSRRYKKTIKNRTRIMKY
jgi:hypothetical protein